jgi:hypothetical protein
MLDGSGYGVRYRQPPLLFRNTGGRYRDVSPEAGPAFRKELSARGLAVGDYDNDGRVDALLANNGMAPTLLRNESAERNHWIGVRLEAKFANRDAVGATVAWSAGGVVRRRQKVGGGSYLSSHDPRLVLGLGAATKADWVEVTWPKPSGRVERFTNLTLDSYVTLVEGSGKEQSERRPKQGLGSDRRPGPGEASGSGQRPEDEKKKGLGSDPREQPASRSESERVKDRS